MMDHSAIPTTVAATSVAVCTKPHLAAAATALGAVRGQAPSGKPAPQRRQTGHASQLLRAQAGLAEGRRLEPTRRRCTSQTGAGLASARTKAAAPRRLSREPIALPLPPDQDFDSHYTWDESQQRFGAGAYGVVEPARDRRTGVLVAVKKTHAGRRTEPTEWLVHHRLCQLSLTAPELKRGVVRFIGLFTEGDAQHAVLEAADCNLHTYRERLFDESGCRTQPLSERNVADLLVASGRGVAAMHEYGIVHRDIKPGNLLVFWQDAEGTVSAEPGDNKSPLVKLSDFGHAKYKDAGCKSPRGTRGFSAFEVVANQGPYDGTAADVYSFGKTLVYMLTGCVYARQTDAPGMGDLLAGADASTGSEGAGGAGGTSGAGAAGVDYALSASASPDSGGGLGRILYEEWPAIEVDLQDRGLSAGLIELLGTMLVTDPAARSPMARVMAHPWWNDAPGHPSLCAAVCSGCSLM